MKIYLVTDSRSEAQEFTLVGDVPELRRATGQKDIHNREIHEGDIVESDLVLDAVVHRDGKFVLSRDLDLHDLNDDGDPLEIVGNMDLVHIREMSDGEARRIYKVGLKELTSRLRMRKGLLGSEVERQGLVLNPKGKPSELSRLN